MSHPITPRSLHICNPHFKPRMEPLRSLATRILGCSDLADDAVQEALIALWKCSPAPEKPQSWLARAVVHRSLHHLRTIARRRRHECEAAGDCTLQADPAAAVERTELRNRLTQAIDALPPEFRIAFELYELKGLDYQQISDQVRIPVGTVRSRIFRARRRLREILTAGAA